MSEPLKRRSERIFALVPIRLTGSDANGESFTEETTTVNVNKHGACISTTRLLRPGEGLLVKNLRNGIEEPVRVIGETQRIFGPRQEWGVEFLNPESKIWGLDFAHTGEDVRPKALIACTVCKTVVFKPLYSSEYSMLLSMGLVSRHCDRCDETTRWKPSDEPPTPEVVILPDEPRSAKQELRREPRTGLVMLLRVRNSQGEQEKAQTLDVSKSGARFLSKRKYGIGEKVFVTLPFSEEREPKEINGKIVWAQKVPSGQLYGVKFEN